MSTSRGFSRRGLFHRCAMAAGTACVGAVYANVRGYGAEPAAPPEAKQPQAADERAMLYGTIGNVKISRLMLGGNLVSGCMHSRDLGYVGPLFRAYMTEQKILETFSVAEANGINTLFESGAEWALKYNEQCRGHMQFIPSIHPNIGQPEQELKDEIKRLIDSGAVALYVWGVAGDRLVQTGSVAVVAKAVEYAKAHGLPVGVGGHSLQVPMACEKHGVPCDFYVKTLHRDDYPSATPKPLRKEYIWLDGGEGWYDNMWCINPEETVAFMRTVKKPWIAFKVLAAGAIHPRQGFSHAFDSGADFIAVGMFDFQIKEDAELAVRSARRAKERQRPWLA